MRCSWVGGAVALACILSAAPAGGQAYPAEGDLPAQPDVVRPMTPIPPERLEQMVPKHPGYLGALAPENLARDRPPPPFNLTGTWFVDLSKGFADYMFGPPYPKFGAEGREALIERIRLVDDGKVMQVEYMLIDPQLWEGEWKSTKRFNRQDYTDINEANCILQYNANLPGTNLGSETAAERGQSEIEGVDE